LRGKAQKRAIKSKRAWNHVEKKYHVLVLEKVFEEDVYPVFLAGMFK